jgi:hypothetical protein
MITPTPTQRPNAASDLLLIPPPAIAPIGSSVLSLAVGAT